MDGDGRLTEYGPPLLVAWYNGYPVAPVEAFQVSGDLRIAGGRCQTGGRRRRSRRGWLHQYADRQRH